MPATLSTELFAKMPARVGLLADVASGLGAHGINIVAIGAYDKSGMGEFYLMTDDNDAATRLLVDMGAEVVENAVVVIDLEERPGSLGEAARAIADGGVNISWVYATTSGAGREMAVFRTADNEAAVALVNQAS